MLTKKMTPVGNSLALIIDRAVLKMLNIDENTVLKITNDGKQLMVSPIRDPKRVRKFREALDKTNRRHGKVLKKLAE